MRLRPMPPRAAPLARGTGLVRTTRPGQGEAPGYPVPLRQVAARRPAGELWPVGRPACYVPWCADPADTLHLPLTRKGAVSDREFPLCRRHLDMVTFHHESELGWAYELGLLA